MLNSFLIGTSILLGVVGQLALKQGVARVMQTGGVQTTGVGGVIFLLWRFLTHPLVLGGFVVYGISALLWLLVLSRVSLSTAYPMLSLGYVLVVLFAWLFLGEALTPFKVAGVLLICLGVAFLGRG